MNPTLWTTVDRYWTEQLHDADPVLDAALAANAAAGLPAIDVSPAQGKLLHLLARQARARRILEIGTLGGYSTIWLARALPPDGILVTCELNPHHAEVATANLARAGLADRVDVRIGPALDTLVALPADEPFDVAFVDADKPSNTDYFRQCLRLVRPGGTIVVDNVVRGGAIVDADSTDRNVLGTRQLAEAVAAEERVDATVIQTVGSKGYDGFLLALVRE
ncbi:Predicted O-methyltransferase YrrM [Pseudonocardia thermophila]|uniref:Predicted O-methyltransferase YrrM n=1 Tax=Pseudonocardia thermophila TaxID=1848 RepID=A0A1M6R1S7_PSETH|nr:O-methyltransferase [Pseudonocardia thermophila]SHK26383.1 Predicted O-methyltransferase YrrM [Pseudonocardia thermophila]